MQSKTILITGSTDGLGRNLAFRFAQKGATLILHGRNPEKGKQLIDDLRSETGNSNLYYYNADFASLEEVKQFSKEIIAHHQQLHILINNAAIGGGPKDPRGREASKNGLELRFALNYLSHFLLTENLLPLLKASAPAKVINVSSIGQSPLDFNDMMMEKNYDSFTAYCRSKLAQIMHGFELADKLKDQNITVNSLHPATLMNTNMVHDFFGRVSTSVDEGADVVEYVAASSETENVTGAYFNQKQQAKANNQAYDKAARKKLWQISENLTKAFRI